MAVPKFITDREELEKLEEADIKGRQTTGPSVPKPGTDPALLPPDPTGETKPADGPKVDKPTTNDGPPVRKPENKPPVTRPETPDKPAGEKRKGKKGDG